MTPTSLMATQQLHCVYGSCTPEHEPGTVIGLNSVLKIVDATIYYNLQASLDASHVLSDVQPCPSQSVSAVSLCSSSHPLHTLIRQMQPAATMALLTMACN